MQQLETNALIERINRGVIGRHYPMETPFGRRPLIYADYTASGRSLDFIEEQIQQQVLPSYANTHSETSYTGAQTMAFREEARQIIHRALNGCASDKIIFCGSGATSAINRLIDILGLRIAHDLDRRYSLAQKIPASERPVVFIGPYEHHSNELPWRETLAQVVRIPLATNGAIDCQTLVSELRRYSDRPLRIGSFSAASNVTGVRSDVVGITRILKEADALAFWDYAAAAPYVGIDLNSPGAAIDAAFISTHKFVGGPSTPGILAVKEALLTNSVPAVVGGGTVAFVSSDSHRYLAHAERREEGGTPAIVESIRAGLAFKLQQAVGTDEIEAREQRMVTKVMARLGSCKNLQILGPHDTQRLPIFSLRVFYQGRDLHYGFVTALLNDLFGIQARGGCSCAGPYGHDLLQIARRRSLALDACVQAGDNALRPGWVRLNFNYFIDDQECEYLLRALEHIAQHGWRLLPAYKLDRSSGLWSHRSSAQKSAVPLEPFEAFMTSKAANLMSLPDYAELIHEGERLLLSGASKDHLVEAAKEPVWQGACEQWRWFLLPRDVATDTPEPTVSMARLE